MKKFMNFIGEGVGEKFLFEIRRVTTTADFFRVCENFLDHDRADDVGAAGCFRKHPWICRRRFDLRI